MYRELTQGIQVEANPCFVPEESKPEQSYYVFTYRIKITNLGDVPVQLLSRHWIITDGHGKVHEVKGPGVIGAQPKLFLGQDFEYSSFCPLPTPTGSMRGTYKMVDADHKEFEVRIPLFFLRDMRNLH